MNSKIKKVIDEVLLRSGSKAAVELHKHFPGNRLVGGKYSPSTHTVTLYLEEIKCQCIELFSNDSLFLQYLFIVFAHELGHAEDTDLTELSRLYDISDSELEKKQIALKIEENAWDFAREIVPAPLKGLMEHIIAESLRSYREALQPMGA